MRRIGCRPERRGATCSSVKARAARRHADPPCTAGLCFNCARGYSTACLRGPADGGLGRPTATPGTGRTAGAPGRISCASPSPTSTALKLPGEPGDELGKTTSCCCPTSFADRLAAAVLAQVSPGSIRSRSSAPARSACWPPSRACCRRRRGLRRDHIAARLDWPANRREPVDSRRQPGQQSQGRTEGVRETAPQRAKEHDPDDRHADRVAELDGGGLQPGHGARRAAALPA